MSKMDFCPYEGITIDPGNLAYELVFSDGWSWDRVKKETPLGEDRKLYISENDSRRKHYSGNMIDSPVILLESGSSGGKTGLALFCERLTGTLPGKTIDGRYKDIVRAWLDDVELSCKYEINKGHTGLNTDRHSDEYNRFMYSSAEGAYNFYTQSDELIMKAVPCCPHCHRRLPEGWLEADDFIGISVVAPHGSGKTAFIDTLIHNNCEAFKDITAAYGRELRFNASAESTAETGFIRTELIGEGDKKTLIAGIYDTSEYLTEDGRYKRGIPDGEIMSRMDADLYLFDIRQMGITGVDPQKIAGKTEFTACSMMTLEEQAEFQKKNAGKIIHASELLKARRTTGKKNGNRIAADDFYYHITEERRKYERSHLDRMMFAGVINKIDLIESREKKGPFAPLFDRNSDFDMTDINSMTARNMLVQELMGKYRMLSDRRLRECGSVYGKGVSWHGISPLGCDALDDGTLTGDHKPIRTAEPVLMCIMRKIAENGWI